MLKRFLTSAARRAASDPRVRQKAKETYETRAKPYATQKSEEIRGIARETDPKKEPAKFAGRVVRKFLNG